MPRFRSWRSRYSYGFFALVCAWICSPALAQPTAAVFATSGPQTRRVHELDQRIKHTLGASDKIRVAVTPRLDLNAVQAALDCRNDSVGCLRGVASEFGVDVLIAPAIELGQGDLVLTLLYFDARGPGSLTRVTHWQLGAKLAPETLAAVPELLDALMSRTEAAPVARAAESGIREPVAATAPAPKEPAPTNPPSPTEQRAPAQGVSLAPCIVLASGAALIGAGLVTGIMLQSNARDYRSQPVRTRAEADVAANARHALGTQARLANILYGVGAAATLLGGAWLTFELIGHDDRDLHSRASSTRVAATLTPMQLGMVLQHQGDWL